ncbi:MAG TPA: hypothetical protein VE196_08165 [Pseudonocardiaceae bacterium]|nr:hypothetical protein [Pseudonocardiaceae bacterium]
MTVKREQNWQPITMLPTIVEVVTGMLDGAADQQRLLDGAGPTAWTTPPSTASNGSTSTAWTGTRRSPTRSPAGNATTPTLRASPSSPSGSLSYARRINGYSTSPRGCAR